MLDFQERVIKEKKELDVKIKKLGDFLESKEYLSKVVGRECVRLHKQLEAMLSYSNILNERILFF